MRCVRRVRSVCGCVQLRMCDCVGMCDVWGCVRMCEMCGDVWGCVRMCEDVWGCVRMCEGCVGMCEDV